MQLRTWNSTSCKIMTGCEPGCECRRDRKYSLALLSTTLCTSRFSPGPVHCEIYYLYLFLGKLDKVRRKLSEKVNDYSQYQSAVSHLLPGEHIPKTVGQPTKF